jgi:hypothetical protein
MFGLDYHTKRGVIYKYWNLLVDIYFISIIYIYIFRKLIKYTKTGHIIHERMLNHA